MAKILRIGSTGRATFFDGPFEPATAAEAALANHTTMHPDGPFEIVQTLPADYTYQVQEHDGALYLMRRSNKAVSKTSDSESEQARLTAINARNRAFWDRPAPARKSPAPGAA